MIFDQQIPELRMYRQIENLLPVDADDTYAKFVTANGSDALPAHRWFRYKESFSPDLLSTILNLSSGELGRRFRLLDPFCGVATGLLASQEAAAMGFSINATGIERNPFVAFVAQTKVQWPNISTNDFRKTAEELLDSGGVLQGSLPNISSVSKGRCISRYMAMKVVSMKERIESVSNPVLRDSLLLGLASAIEAVSKVRKDGRALRIVSKPRTTFASELAWRWEQIAQDSQFLQETIPSPNIPRIVVGDGRDVRSAGIARSSIDLIVTSPPYPNNIDYSEVYKLELWLLGFVNTPESFLKLRKTTLRSHPTCSAPKPQDGFLDELKNGSLRKLLGPLLRRTERSAEKWRSRLLLGYFSDLWAALRSHYSVLKNGGIEVVIVGNSLHGNSEAAYLIPTDIAIATMADVLGFRVNRLLIARALKRRLQGNHFLRESIIFLQKK